MNLHEHFLHDVEENEIAELITEDVLNCLTNDYEFTNVRDVKEYQHKGDILVKNKKDGSTTFVEVKNDSRIAGREDSTGNILCEDMVYYEDKCEWKHGFMRYCNDYLAVVSRQAQKIFILDLSVLKRYYRQGSFVSKMKVLPGQYSSVFLYPLEIAERVGALLYEIDYFEVGDEEDHVPFDIREVEIDG